MRKMVAILMIIAASNIQVSWTLDCQTNRRCGLSTEEDGYDYYTTASLGVEVTNTKVDCSCLCQQTDDCTAWTWVKDGGACWLKKDSTGRIETTDIVSGREECENSKEETGYDFPGNNIDMARKDLKEDCKSWCESLKYCTRWLFIEGRKGTNCWLKYGDMASQDKTKKKYDVTEQTAYSEYSEDWKSVNTLKEEKMAEVMGFDYPCSGCDIHYGEGGTKEHCKYHCELKEECVRWMFIEGVDGGANRCWLKKWNPEQVKYGGKGSIYSALVIQCSEDSPCGIDEGDCDNHSQCVGSLVCGIQNCVNKFEGFGYKDCCFLLPKGKSQVCRGGDNCCTGECLENEGDCDTNSDCKEPLVCGSDNCRGSSFDGDDDCCYAPKSVDCGRFDEGNWWYWKTKAKGDCNNCKCCSECCPSESRDPTEDCCSSSNRCAIGEGDCDSDSDCQDGLTCGDNNCQWEKAVKKTSGRHFFGFKDDCCKRKK